MTTLNPVAIMNEGIGYGSHSTATFGWWTFRHWPHIPDDAVLLAAIRHEKLRSAALEVVRAAEGRHEVTAMTTEQWRLQAQVVDARLDADYAVQLNKAATVKNDIAAKAKETRYEARVNDATYIATRLPD